MTHVARHPGRSPEFLSRLHDGDLPAAERAQFEAHRAHCSECRAAAAEFEAALALYRSSRTHPPPPDLSSRILRKLQAANPRRSPFGVTFGIDLRWAGAFIAALLAVIIGSSVVVRHEASERKVSQGTPIPVVIGRDDRATGKDKAPVPIAQPRAAGIPPAPSSRGPASSKIAAEEEAAPIPSSRRQAAGQPDVSATSSLDKETSARRESEVPPASGRSRELKSQAPAPPQVKGESPALLPRSPDRAGGEGAGSSNIAVDALTDRVRLDILAIDGAGPPPPLLNGQQIDVPPELRGRVFELVVEAGGRVRQVRSTDARLKALPQQGSARSDAVLADEKTSGALKDLRFQPGDRPRVLRVRIE